MKRPRDDDQGALYVRLPATAVDKLDRAAESLGIHKKDLVAGLVAKYVDPDSRRGLSALNALTPPRRVMLEPGSSTPTLGSYSFQAYERHDNPEVMTIAQTAELLQLADKVVLTLAEAGKLPGKKLGADWRFSRTAVLAWLASPE